MHNTIISGISYHAVIVNLGWYKSCSWEITILCQTKWRKHIFVFIPSKNAHNNISFQRSVMFIDTNYHKLYLKENILRALILFALFSRLFVLSIGLTLNLFNLHQFAEQLRAFWSKEFHQNTMKQKKNTHTHTQLEGQFLVRKVAEMRNLTYYNSAFSDQHW